MKGCLILELFGEDTRQLFKIYRKTFEVLGGDFGRIYFDKNIGMPPRSSWAAEITGPDEKYRLARKFLKGKIDYSKSNSKGSRGIFVEYILSQGKIYEVKSQESWKNAERYFCTVSDEGDIIHLDEESVCHSFGALTRSEYEERKQWTIAEITGPDERYILARNFLKCDLHYCEADIDSLYPGFNLQEGKIYEVWKQGKYRKGKSYFKIVDGKKVEIDETEVYHSVGALTFEERREKYRAERISGDKRT